jgi:hypothetical protein
MNHFGPDLQIDAGIGGAGRFGQPDRVVKQGLRRTDLDQQRRQAVFPFNVKSSIARS